MQHTNPLTPPGTFACTTLAAAIMLCGGMGAPALAAPPAKKPAAAKEQPVPSEVLRRLQELEAQVAQFREETQRLRTELAQRPAALATPTPTPTAAKPAAPRPAPAGGDWDEPEVAQKAQGRDDEARRRLLVLETQARKAVAEAVKREAETKDKVAFEFSGKYKAQVNSRHNFNLNNSQQQWRYDNASFVDQRYSLQVDASYEALLTRLVLDKGNFSTDWKEDSEGTLERWGQFQTLSSPLVRELFIQYTGPFMVRAGRQSWDVGQRIVLEGPMDGIRLQYPLGQLPWGQTTLTAGYVAVPGGWGDYSNFQASGGRLGGNRQAVFGASNSLDALYADLDIRASRALRFRPYVLKTVDRGRAGDADLNLDKDFNASTLPRDGHFEPLWMGLSASATVDQWRFDAEGVLLRGDYSASRTLRASALVVKAARDFGKLGGLDSLSAGLQFGRGSGNRIGDAASGPVRNFNALFMCRERNKFGLIFSEDVRAGYYLWDSNLTNITYLRLDTTLEPRQGFKLTPSLTRIWTTEPVLQGRGPVHDWSQGTASATNLTKNVGWELDLNVVFPLYKRLEGFLSIGYFRPGAVYARPDGSNPKPAREFVLGVEAKF
ncbi:alginate export family protein [Rhodoferax sp.]|uniref:alginate export family protein n=1 Tax=Rhodoferax sp. TaxID=50421 RepID=UPI002747C0D9|nr:alginate export family protein [Rhodoferax sp.]